MKPSPARRGRGVDAVSTAPVAVDALQVETCLIGETFRFVGGSDMPGHGGRNLPLIAPDPVARTSRRATPSVRFEPPDRLDCRHRSTWLSPILRSSMLARLRHFRTVPFVVPQRSAGIRAGSSRARIAPHAFGVVAWP